MSKLVTFLTRTRGNPNTASKFGVADFLAYSYLLLGVLIILVPVFWTFLSSIKPERAIDNFDIRLLPIAQIESDVEGIGVKPIWEYTAEDGTVTDVFKAVAPEAFPPGPPAPLLASCLLDFAGPCLAFGGCCAPPWSR